MAQRKGTDDGNTGSGIGSVGAPRAVDSAALVGPTDEVEGAAPVRAAGEVGAPIGAGGVDQISAVAAALRAGELTVAEAVDRLIDDAVQKQVGRAIEPGSEIEARLRRVLRDHAGADPLISVKIRRLEGRRPGR